MTRRHIFAAALVLLLMAMPALADVSVTDRQPTDLLPDYHALGNDGPASMTVAPDGTLWATWSIWFNGEQSIGVSYMIGETWSLPMLIGNNNGYDDHEPEMAFFSDGSAILSWWQTSIADSDEAPRVVASFYMHGRWTQAQPLSKNGVPSRSPSIMNTTDSGDATVGWTTIIDGRWEGIDFRVVPKPKPEGSTNGPDPMPELKFKDVPGTPGGGG